MATATRGLSTADITSIRETLAAGRKPKVIFTESAGQVVGKVGQVIELNDPKASDDWIVVRFGRDELPFSPSDLAVPDKASAARTPAPKRAEPVPEPPPLRLSEPPKPIKPREEPPMPASNVPPSNGSASNGTASNGTAANGTAASGSAGPAGSNGKPARVPKPKPVASLTVTLAYTDREWTIAAQQGSKTLAKPYVIKPTEALQMVALIDMPGVHEAVEAIIEAERAEAESRALRLREELAEIESRLAELTSKV